MVGRTQCVEEGWCAQGNRRESEVEQRQCGATGPEVPENEQVWIGGHETWGKTDPAPHQASLLSVSCML
jgi:hypothetical protein